MKTKSSDYKLLSGLFFRLLPYQVLLIVISAVNGIVDSLYASNVIGKAGMSAIGLFGPMNHFLYAMSIMFVSGSQILYGRYLARDRQKIHGLFSVNVLISTGLALLTSLLLVLGVVTGATRILIDQEPDLGMLNDYILGQAIGIPALVLGQQLFAFLSLENQTKRTMTASIVCFAANAVLDHVCIVSLGMGTFGLGLSSSIANWIFLAVMAVWYIRGKSEWKFSLRAARWKDAPAIMRLGYPGALSRFVEMFRCLIVNFLVIQYVGSVGLSAFAASNSLLAVVWAVPFGMMAVARMLFSISIGEEDRRSLIDVMRIVMTRGMLVMTGIVILLIVFAEPLTRLFYQDPSDPVFEMTVMGFRILPLCMLPAMWSLHYASYAQTMEKKAMSIILPVVDGVVGVVLFSFILIRAERIPVRGGDRGRRVDRGEAVPAEHRRPDGHSGKLRRRGGRTDRHHRAEHGRGGGRIPAGDRILRKARSGRAAVFPGRPVHGGNGREHRDARIREGRKEALRGYPRGP